MRSARQRWGSETIMAVTLALYESYFTRPPEPDGGFLLRIGRSGQQVAARTARFSTNIKPNRLGRQFESLQEQG